MQSVWQVGFPPRATALWIGRRGGPGKASPGGGDCPPGWPGPEGDLPSNDRAHDSGPSVSLPVAMGYGVNGSVATGHDVLVTEETDGGRVPREALWCGNRVGQRARNLGVTQASAVGFMSLPGRCASRPSQDHPLVSPSADIQGDPGGGGRYH